VNLEDVGSSPTSHPNYKGESMAKKLGTLKIKRLFLGTDSGKRGTEVTSSAAELNQLGDGAITGNVTGSATKLVAGTAPVNAVKATGILTFDTFATIGDTILIGSRTYTFVADGSKSADGEIDIGASTAAHSQVEILAAIDGSDTNSAINTDVTIGAFDATDAAIVTNITAGVAGNAVATVVTDASAASNKFTAATQTNGLDGTVGDAGTTIVANGTNYVAKAANTIAGANWKIFPQAPFAGTGVLPQTVTTVIDLGETDFDSDVILLDGSAACTITDWTPTVGVTYIIQCIESTNDPVLNLTTGITFDATGNDIITFGDAEDTVTVKMVTTARMVIINNSGATAPGA
jgi:hypothetical protein